MFHFGTPLKLIWDVVKLNFTTSQIDYKIDYRLKYLSNSAG